MFYCPLRKWRLDKTDCSIWYSKADSKQGEYFRTIIFVGDFFNKNQSRRLCLELVASMKKPCKNSTYRTGQQLWNNENSLHRSKK